MFIFGDKKFENPEKIITAFDEKTFKEAFLKLEVLKNDFYLPGYISYQAKDVFLNKKIKTSSPLLYFEAHGNYTHFEPAQDREALLFLKENLNKKEYFEAIEKIKEYISKGATYEVNYTFSNDVFSPLEGFELFCALLKNQKTKYAAYVKNEFDEILSFSPELFFEIKDGKIFTKPMKGTIKRAQNPDLDKKQIEFLKNDRKNLSENTMIVDLLRNDLSKINFSKNTKVEKLFEVETHKTLHQMTSTISAELSKVDLYDIFCCLFPCGSITGAPKISTMEIIDEVENFKRNIYCGALGVISKDECEFSVPIRILEKKNGDKKFIFSQGGAIVWLSEAEDEFEECRTKRLFLGENLEFNLFETILIKNGRPQLFSEHLKRLSDSAKVFGFSFNTELFNLKFEGDKIAKIELSKNGEFKISYREILPLGSNKITVSKNKVNSNNPFLLHKTTFRPWFLESFEKIQNNEIFDEIFVNEKNEITEGARSNVVLKFGENFYTPFLYSGLLGGVFRESLIKSGKISEKKLFLEDLECADKIFLINSVRGMVEVKL